MIRSLAALAAVFALSIPAGAQRPSNWTTLTLPTDATSVPNSIGTMVSFTTATSVYLYSGITKRWTVLPFVPTSPIFQANDYAIVRNGNQIYGYSSHTGAAQSITTVGTPTIVSGPASSSWVTLVADGTQAYAFGAFHGRWEPLTLSQPAPVMTSNRLLGLLRDGSTVYGVSAHHGTFVPVAADTAATLSVVGEAEVGTANSPGILRAFSAQQNRWGTQVVANPSGSYQQNEFAMMWSGNQIWAFSGLTGAMTSYTANNPIASVTGAEGIASFVDGSQMVFYGSGRGQFAARTVGTPTVLYDYHLALINEGTQVTPFSAITCTFGPTIYGQFFTNSNDEIGYADGGTQIYGYSPILNTWTLAPIITPSSVTLVRSAVVLGDAAGYWAMSARHGTWVRKTTTLTGSFQGPATGATFVALDGIGETAHVFDARLNRWASISGVAPLTVRISRHTLMCHDGVFAYGFGQPSGEWFSQLLTTPPTRFDTASSIGSVGHGTSLSVYSVQGSFSYTGRYPEFTQAINLGNTLAMHQVAAPGSALLFLSAFAPAFIDVRPTLDGVLYLDPASLLTQFWPQAVDADGILDMNLPIPANPAFAGLQLHLQNVVLEPSGQPWLSSSVAPILF